MDDVSLHCEINRIVVVQCGMWITSDFCTGALLLQPYYAYQRVVWS